MIVDVEIGGRRRRVELERTQDRWRATIDGRTMAIEAVRVGTGWSLLVGPPAPGPREEGEATTFSPASYELTLDNRGQGDLTIHLDGHAIDARVLDPRAFARRARDHAHGSRGDRRQITAPMPGRVVKVLVKPGDAVSARQGLVVVEAMKMENELRAPGDATVREVRAIEGASVEAGAILVILE